MSYKSIIALTFGHAGDATALAFAAGLAVTHKAHAGVFPFAPDPSLDLIGYGMLLGTTLPAETSAALVAEQERLRHQLADQCRRICNEADLIYGEGAGLPRLELLRPAGRPEIALSHALALADLVVISHESLAAVPVARAAFGQVLLQQRAPVLLARGDAETLGDPVVIAWDGSAEAGRAVRQALPLIAMASATLAVQCRAGLDREAANPSFGPLLAYLVAHAAGTATTETIETGPEGPAILQAAARRNAGLIVAGAWGHTRVREAMFGGATRALLDAIDGPSLLLAH
jgi:nucleotide-binding universal stress UspA family protein